MSTWFASDHHFGHVAIVKMAGRPFADVHDMDEQMTRRWNETVSKHDVVYHLGDFALGPRRLRSQYAYRLNGRKLLVPGNHDEIEIVRGRRKMTGFDVLEDNVVVEIDGVRVWMNHYPSAGDDERHLRRPAAPSAYDVALCGHVHGKWKVCDGIVNVGVDVWNYRPVSLAQLVDASRQQS